MRYPKISVRWSESGQCYVATVGAEAARPASQESLPPAAAGRADTPWEAVRRLCDAYDAISSLADDIDGL